SDDGSRDRYRAHARSLRFAGRAPRQRRLVGARAAQALHRLDLGRLPDHGARRAPRGIGSALPDIRKDADLAYGSFRAGMNSRVVWVAGIFLALVALLAVGLRRDPREVPSPLVGKA